MNRLPVASSSALGFSWLMLVALTPATPAQPPAPPAADLGVLAFKKNVESRLDEERARIRKIAQPVLERIRRMRKADLKVAAQEIVVMRANKA